MSKDKIKKELEKLINGYTKDLLNGLSNAKILTKLNGSEDKFIVTRNAAQDYSTREGGELNFLSTLLSFRQIVLSVYSNIFDDHKTTTDKLSSLINQLSADGLFKPTWIGYKPVLYLFDQINLMQRDSQFKSQAQKTFADRNINLNQAANELLNAYGTRKSREYFASFNYLMNTSIENNTFRKFDLLLVNKEYYFKNLIFEFKVRRGKNPLDVTLALQTLRTLEEFDTASNEKNATSAMILTVFVEEPYSNIPRLNFIFRDIIAGITAFDTIKGRIFLNAVPIESLHLITKGFADFKNEFIEGTFETTFESRTPPRDFPFRNDFLHERVIDIRKYNLDVTVSPGQLNGWRFGFRFSEVEEIGFVLGERHSNPNYYDIHIAVGNVDTASGNAEWKDPNLLDLISYHIEVLEDQFKGDLNYQKQPVTIMLRYGHTDDTLHILINVGNTNIGRRVYSLKKHYFFRMFAWADGIEFSLKAKVKTERFMY